MKKLNLLFAACCMAVSTMGQTSKDTVYVFKTDMPNAGYFLPAPPDTASAAYMDDLLQWQWGKSQRPTPRGAQASRESEWLPSAMRMVMAEVLQLDTISDEKTPAISHLLVRAYNTGSNSTAAAKKKYMRKRPFMQMGEDTWALYDTDFLRTNGSYPSGHTAFGWATALVFAEMWPELQDTILRRGFQFGENRIITGAHYQSDVNAGYMCAAASIARAHSNGLLTKDIAAARAEYAAIKGLSKQYDPTAHAGYPNGDRFLNAAVDTTSQRFLSDIARYWQARSLRNTERGRQAIADGKNDRAYVLQMYGKAIGATLSEQATPAITELVDYVMAKYRGPKDQMKANTFRKRPFVQLKDCTSVPEYEETARHNSSYVSGHSCLGWTTALVMAELVPQRQDEVLRCGFQYGESRQIIGYHWATDIEAARLLACAIVARMHADKNFQNLIKKARQEAKSLIKE